MKLLIIEDNRDLQKIYQDLFTSAGHEVAVSDNGLTGITEVAENPPEVILLDIMTPELNGYDFLTALKHNTSIQSLVIVCSNLGQQTDVDRALARGADHYLKKSDYIGEDLVKEVERLYIEHRSSLSRDNP